MQEQLHFRETVHSACTDACIMSVVIPRTEDIISETVVCLQELPMRFVSELIHAELSDTVTN